MIFNVDPDILIPVLVLLTGVIFSIRTKRLTPVAALTGFVCGSIIYAGAGYTGLILMTSFFLLGTLATSWGKRQKQYLAKPNDHNQRKSSQVLANAGAATVLALLALIFYQKAPLFQLMLAASFASATSDTLSSELGMLYGKNCYNCLSWKREAKGLDGVISLEGTLCGIVGSIVIAAIFSLGMGFDLRFLIIVIAATAGNLSDSVFGAAFERKKLLNNDWVNFLSTAFAAGVSWILYSILM
jgi:uncharacterized protein (TIGR00297 family)